MLRTSLSDVAALAQLNNTICNAATLAPIRCFSNQKNEVTLSCANQSSILKSGQQTCTAMFTVSAINQNKISVSTLTSVLLCLNILSTESVSYLRKTHSCIKHTVFKTHATSSFWRQHVYLSSCPCQSVSAAASIIFSLVKTWHVTKMHHTH